VTEMGIEKLSIRYRKLWKRKYGPEGERGIWIIKSNQEMRKLYKYLDIVADI
jgi:hypothetical protein